MVYTINENDTIKYYALHGQQFMLNKKNNQVRVMVINEKGDYMWALVPSMPGLADDYELALA